MPRLQPPHEQFLPEEPSPLGLYWYTATDIEESSLRNTRTADSGATSPAKQEGDADADDDRGDEESSRKRRRIAVDADGEGVDPADVTIEYVGRSRPGPLGAFGSDEAARWTTPATTDAGWSFGAPEEDVEPIEAIPVTEPQTDGDSMSEDALPALPPTPRLAPVGPDAYPAGSRGARQRAQASLVARDQATGDHTGAASSSPASASAPVDNAIAAGP